MLVWVFHLYEVGEVVSSRTPLTFDSLTHFTNGFGVVPFAKVYCLKRNWAAKHTLSAGWQAHDGIREQKRFFGQASPLKRRRCHFQQFRQPGLDHWLDKLGTLAT